MAADIALVATLEYNTEELTKHDGALPNEEVALFLQSDFLFEGLVTFFSDVFLELVRSLVSLGPHRGCRGIVTSRAVVWQ